MIQKHWSNIGEGVNSTNPGVDLVVVFKINRPILPYLDVKG